LCASGSNFLNIWGRVKDHQGHCVKGAPVILMSLVRGEEKCLGYTYSSLQGIYCFRIDGFDQKTAGAKLRVFAGIGDCPATGESAASYYSCNLLAGDGKKTVECRVINYCCLKIIVSGEEGQIAFDTVPETVKVSYCRDSITGSRTYGITGRGYITSESDSGEGEFRMVVCLIGEGLQEQELVRIMFIPEDRNRKSLFFDSGRTGLKLL